MARSIGERRELVPERIPKFRLQAQQMEAAAGALDYRCSEPVIAARNDTGGLFLGACKKLLSPQCRAIRTKTHQKFEHQAHDYRARQKMLSIRYDWVADAHETYRYQRQRHQRKT